MSTPLVSIVLPTYNGSQYLAVSIESCLAQTYPHWELIIVDDASTDTTSAIITEYVAKDARIKSVRHPVNRKLPAALNTGFALAQGELLTWTSDDNLYRPHALAAMVGFLQTHPDVDLVYTNYTLIDANGESVSDVQVPESKALALGSFVGPSFLFHHTVFEKVGGYDEGLFLAEDYDFWLRASNCCSLAPCDVNCYAYRIHSPNLSSTFKACCLTHSR